MEQHNASTPALVLFSETIAIGCISVAHYILGLKTDNLKADSLWYGTSQTHNKYIQV